MISTPMRNSPFPELVAPSARYWPATLFLIFAGMLFVSQATAEGDAGKAEEQQALQQVKNEYFVYQYENRKDPFMPFITENATSHSQDEIIEDGQPLTGMQLFEPGQLTLVGLLSKGSEYYAMVEDSTGKGYTLTKGMKIGRRGVIRDIGPAKVLIEESGITRAGKKLVTSVEMALKKEGEK
jgi:type IV pilus assembly protein PilP